MIVTSSSCSGTCLILSIPRQPKVSAAASALGARRARRGDSAVRAPRVGGGSASRRLRIVLMPPCSARADSSSASCSRPGGRSAPGTPRRGSAGRARSPRAAMPGRAQLGHRLRRPGRRRRTAPTAPPGRPRGGPRRARARARARASGRSLGVEQPHVQRARPTDALAGRACPRRSPCRGRSRRSRRRAGRPRRGTACRAGSSCPLGDERADDVPHLVARARVEPGRRLVEEHQLAA